MIKKNAYQNSHEWKIKSTGQALPEYVVGVLMIMLAMFAPIPAFNDQSAVELLTNAFQKNYRGYEYVMSQPSND